MLKVHGGEPVRPFSGPAASSMVEQCLGGCGGGGGGGGGNVSRGRVNTSCRQPAAATASPAAAALADRAINTTSDSLRVEASSSVWHTRTL